MGGGERGGRGEGWDGGGEMYEGGLFERYDWGMVMEEVGGR